MKDILSRIDNLKNEKQKKESSSKELNKPNEKDNLSEKNNYNQKYTSSRYYNQEYLKRPFSLTRPSMLKLNELIKDYGFFQKRPLIEEDSGNEDNINEETNESIPSLKKVSKYIFDPHTIMIVNNINFFPREAKPGLIITGIEDWVKEKHIKYFLEGIPNNNKNYYYNNIDLSTIKFFKDNQQKTCAYIYPMKFKILETIFNFFHNPIKKYIPTLNSKNEKMEILASFNLLELTKSNWYGIILRNLPKNCTSESIYNFCDGYIKDGINYCLNPIIVDEISCSLVVCKSLESAEKLCSILNNNDIAKNRILLAHFHPLICKIRKSVNNENDDQMFSKNGYLFKENVEQSERCLKYAEYFVKINKKQQVNMDKNKKNEDNDNKNNELKFKNLNQLLESSDNKDNNIKKNISGNKDDSLIESIMNILKIKNTAMTTMKSSDNNIKNNEINKQKNNDSNNKEENNKNNGTSILTNNIEINSSPKIENAKSNITNNNINNENKSNIQNNETQTNKNINTNSNNISLMNNNTSNQSLLTNINPNLMQNSNSNQNNILSNDINNNNSFQEPGEIYDSKNINIDPLSNFSKKDINYYTYNMGNESFYERKEEEMRRKSNRNNNSYYRDNNYKRSKNFNYNSQKYNNRNKSPYKSYKTREYNNQNYYEKYEKERNNEDEDSSLTERIDKYNNNRNYERSRETERRNVKYEKYEKYEYKKTESIFTGKINNSYNYKEPKDYRDKEIKNYKNNFRDKEDYYPKIYQKDSYHKDNSKIYEDYSTNNSTNRDTNDTKNKTFSNSFQEKNISKFNYNNESHHQKYIPNQNREREYYPKNKLNNDNYINKNIEKFKIRDNYSEKEGNNYYYKNKNHSYNQEINRERSREERDKYKNFKSGERPPNRKSSSQRKNSGSYDYHHYPNNTNIHTKKN